MTTVPVSRNLWISFGATFLIRSASPTEVPPYFCTMSAMGSNRLMPHLVGELVEEEPDVGDDAEGLRRAPIGQLRDHGRIDIDADHPHRRGQHVPHADA